MQVRERADEMKNRRETRYFSLTELIVLREAKNCVRGRREKSSRLRSDAHCAEFGTILQKTPRNWTGPSLWRDRKTRQSKSELVVEDGRRKRGNSR